MMVSSLFRPESTLPYSWRHWKLLRLEGNPRTVSYRPLGSLWYSVDAFEELQKENRKKRMAKLIWKRRQLIRVAKNEVNKRRFKNMDRTIKRNAESTGCIEEANKYDPLEIFQ